MSKRTRPIERTAKHANNKGHGTYRAKRNLAPNLTISRR
jgi:hypothetical protein